MNPEPVFRLRTMDDRPFIPLHWTERLHDDMLKRAELNYSELSERRTTRDFSDRDVDRRLIELAILSGSTAPNGAHLQPWMKMFSESCPEKLVASENKDPYVCRMDIDNAVLEYYEEMFLRILS